MIRKIHFVFVLSALGLVASPAAAAPKKRSPKQEAPAPKPADEDKEEETPPSEDNAWTSNESGAALAIRAGYAIPFGSLAKDLAPSDLGKYISGSIPLTLEGGYRFSPHFYLGGFFEFAFATTSSQICAGVAGDCSSSANQLKFGPTFRYNFSPARRFDPFVGFGADYEILTASITQGQQSASIALHGWDYAKFELGADLHVARDFVVAPYASFGLGQYISADETAASGKETSGDFKNSALHEWLTLGVRVQYDL